MDCGGSVFAVIIISATVAACILLSIFKSLIEKSEKSENSELFYLNIAIIIELAHCVEVLICRASLLVIFMLRKSLGFFLAENCRKYGLECAAECFATLRHVFALDVPAEA